MVRKEEALAARCGILDAAEHLVQLRGVSRTTLGDIALATRILCARVGHLAGMERALRSARRPEARECAAR